MIIYYSNNYCFSNDLRKKVVNGPGVIMSRLPKRPPVDIDFSDLAFSVAEGRNRGEEGGGRKRGH